MGFLDTRYIKVGGGNSAANITIENDYLDGNITFKVNDGGVDTMVMTLDGATGNVGIGTTGPKSMLHVAQNDGGNDVVRAPITLSRLWASDSDTRASALFQYRNSSTNRDFLAISVSGDGGSFNSPLDISMAKMTIGADGNVGIGTTTPDTKLDVNGAIRSSSISTSPSENGLEIKPIETAFDYDYYYDGAEFSVSSNMPTVKDTHFRYFGFKYPVTGAKLAFSQFGANYSTKYEVFVEDKGGSWWQYYPSNGTLNFVQNGVDAVSDKQPLSWTNSKKTTVNGQEAYWIRVSTTTTPSTTAITSSVKIVSAGYAIALYQDLGETDPSIIFNRNGTFIFNPSGDKFLWFKAAFQAWIGLSVYNEFWITNNIANSPLKITGKDKIIFGNTWVQDNVAINNVGNIVTRGALALNTGDPTFTGGTYPLEVFDGGTTNRNFYVAGTGAMVATYATTKRIETDATGIGFFAHAPVAQQPYTAISDPPTQAEVTNIRNALINLGLMASL